MASQKKIDIVKKIKDDLINTKSIVLTDHTGLTHQQIERLRKSIKKAGGNFVVVKNTLLKKALTDSPFEGKISENVLTGQTSVLLSINDEISALKELVRVVKELNLPKIKQGALKDKVLESAEVVRLAQLPPKEVLISQLLGMLKSPQSRLVFALKGNLSKLVLILKAVSQKEKVN